MPQPKPWSYSSLSDFDNCPKAYFHKKVLKDVVETKGEATIWGEVVHEHFEHRLRDGVVLPDNIEVHEPFLNYLKSLPGEELVEAKIALNNRLEPCEFFDPEVWYRGVIDYGKINGDKARICDHKTGKHHTKFGQLKLFALHTFIKYPQLESIRAEFYWTQTRTTNGETYSRGDIPGFCQEFLPSLRQYAQAFRDDVWQPRPSGLCAGWCPVTTCEHWRPKRRKK